MSKTKKLNVKHAKFCQEYLIDLNGTQAAIRAGYSVRSARSTAVFLLTHPNIQPEIQRLMNKRSSKTEITAEKVLMEIAKLAYANMEDVLNIDRTTGEAFIDLSKLTRDQAAAIQEYTVDEYMEPDPESEDGKTMRRIKKTKIKLADKNRSLELLARHLKLLTDRVEIDANINHYIHKEFENLTPSQLRAEAEKTRHELARHLTTSSKN